MNKDCFLESERKSLAKMKKLQLPHKFKKLGMGLFIIFFIGIFVNAFFIHNVDLNLISKYGLLVGLLITSISRDKIEDELIKELRMQSYTFAFIFAVVYSITLPFIGYLLDKVLAENVAAIKGMGDFTILWMLLFVQVFFFHYLKFMHK
jgi:hypothetical protein